MVIILKNVVILNFSGRNNGNCEDISMFIETFYVNSNTCSYKVGEYYSPFGNCDYECLRQGPGCPNLTEKQIKIMEDVLASDITYFIVPNYCGFPCANYFAFNERSVGFFHLDRAQMTNYIEVKKKFILVSNTEGDQFHKAMEQQSNSPDTLYLKSSTYQKKSISGDILTSKSAQATLKSFLEKE